MNKIHQLFAVLAAGFLCLPAAAQEISTAQVVDLGLSVKWAGYNIGASAPEQYGSFYAWGETSEKEQYIDATYKGYQDGNTQAILKYCADDYGFQGFKDGKRELDPEDDVAHVQRGTRGVRAAVECDAFPVHQVRQSVGIGAVLDETSVHKDLKCFVHTLLYSFVAFLMVATSSETGTLTCSMESRNLRVTVLSFIVS